MTDRDEDEASELVAVYEANVVEADMVCSLLEGNGIEAVVFKSGMAAYPMTVGPLGGGRVMVRPEDEERAREVLAAADAGELELEQEPEKPARPWIAIAVTAAIAITLVVILLWTDVPKY